MTSTSINSEQVSIDVSEKIGSVSGIGYFPEGCRHLLLLSHGAGAGMTHHFMEKVAVLFYDAGVATLRFNFPYSEQGMRPPNAKPILLKTIYAAIQLAVKDYSSLDLFYAGKSMGGRMGSIAAADGSIPEVKGLAFIGFPLHAPGKDSKDRATHLERIQVPTLFLQGTRDRLANLELIQEVCLSLGESATLAVFEGADHSFNTRKKDPLTTDETIAKVVQTTVDWMTQIAKC